MSIGIKNPLSIVSDPSDLDFGINGLDDELPDFVLGRKNIEVDHCPICGAACLPRHSAPHRSAGFGVRAGRSYPCKNLKVTFCQDCLIGEGGVDIICRVIEANDAQRMMIAHEAYLILKAKRDALVLKIIKWIVGIVIALSVCCLIWTPEEVLIVIAVIAVLFFYGFLMDFFRG